MSHQSAKIFYHVNDSQKQKITIDAHQIAGKIVFPELEMKHVEISDARINEIPPNFKDQSVEFFDYPTEVKSFESNSFKKIYNNELECLLKDKIHAKEVKVFDHTLREDSSAIRPPARHAHIDYTAKSAEQQMKKHIPDTELQSWLNGHYAIVNTWRPIQNKVESAPLGFLLPHSLSKKDLIKIDLIYPNRTGEVTGALYNKNHRWIYLSEMKPTEVALFNMFDSEGKMPIVHSAFDLENTKKGSIRKSIESRILVKF